ncbi:MAG: response regulator [Defluviitaleaceae bacterium]|nr:response regulator [Defluviitaleaceae bacterium]
MVILIVDDVAFMRKIVIDMMVQHFHINRDSIHETNNGKNAVRDYKQLRPNIVFLDVLMPDQNGPETVAEIIEIDPDAYIVMCTSAKERATVRECVKAGAKDYIIKPIDPKRLRVALEKGGYVFNAILPEPRKADKNTGLEKVEGEKY